MIDSHTQLQTSMSTFNLHWNSPSGSGFRFLITGIRASKSKPLCDLLMMSSWMGKQFYVAYGAGWMVSCQTGMIEVSFGGTIVPKPRWKCWRKIKSYFLRTSDDSNTELLFDMLVTRLVVANQIQIQIELKGAQGQG